MTMDTNNRLTPEEKKQLKAEIKKAWPEFPSEMRHFLIEVKKEKLKALYMIEGWAKDNGHETLLDLISRKIARKEAKIKELEAQESA